MIAIDPQPLEDLILGWGADLVGFADMTGLLPYRYDHLSCGISVAIKLSDVVIDGIGRGPTKMYSNLYHTVNRKLDQIAERIVLHLEQEGFQAHLNPASRYVSDDEPSLPHKTVATQGGLGWIGRSNLLITPLYGPRVRLVSVLTDAPFKTAQPTSQSHCGSCMVCIDSCPAKALRGTSWDRSKSTNEMIDLTTCRNHIEKFKRKLNAPVCGVCISVCPRGTGRRHTK